MIFCYATASANIRILWILHFSKNFGACAEISTRHPKVKISHFSKFFNFESVFWISGNGQTEKFQNHKIHDANVTNVYFRTFPRPRGKNISIGISKKMNFFLGVKSKLGNFYRRARIIPRAPKILELISVIMGAHT